MFYETVANPSSSWGNTDTHFHLDPSPLTRLLEVICKIEKHLLSLEKNQSEITGMSHAFQNLHGWKCESQGSEYPSTLILP